MTYKDLLKKAEKRIAQTELEIEAAKWLLMHVSNLTPSQFYLAFDQSVKPEVESAFMEGIERYLNYTPIQHIIGYQTFYGYDFIVNEHVLIPRRETEELVEQVLYYYDDHFQGQKVDVCDIGTGSGCIAITLAKEESNMKVVASDISATALEVAKANNQKLDANVTFYEGDLLSPLKGMRFDIIVSNPPYIPNQEDVAKIVRTHEPNIALFGGDTGMIFYERILKDAKKYLKPKGLIAFEHAYDKRTEMYDLAKHYYPNANIIQLKDLSGKDRMTLIEVISHDA
ncbi:peptide chain release factor N(5)-glutamine methyltransferase [Acholeplasma vituli]|uniref:Release factor glutamine methyltransferase n=1 Tax=Paracholeplasma vituli TaxID=69473 RepID=A0ABT2PV87_9MOLU|nr:peptide chain release factor N(5)-glutamine methyltransferase [Paracholeplasma vituli]MCU0104341.1 peptide chain release factor N(5)-glutamine methyltransferase [Paracholeplasma vituli]